MAKEFGWTLDYVDSLSEKEWHDWRSRRVVQDGLRKGYDYVRRKQAFHNK